MGFKGNRGPLIIIGIIIVFFLALAWAASGNSAQRITPPGMEVCTIQSEVGVSTVKITNQNTGTSIVKTVSNLPYSFNFTRGDTLQFNVTMQPEYVFNAWTFNTGTFDNHNPLTIKPTDNVVMTVTVLMK